MDDENSVDSNYVQLQQSLDGELTLTVPPLEVGVTADILASGAELDERALLIRGTSLGAGSCPASLGGQCLGITGTVAMLARSRVNEEGVAEFHWPVPATAPLDMEFCFQAFIKRGPDGADSVLTDAVCGVTCTGDTCVEETTPTTEYEIGHPINDSWTASYYFRGNAYVAEASGIFAGFSQYINLTSPCTVDIYVLSGTSPTGPWTTIWSEQQEVDPGLGYVSSSLLDIPIEAGMAYGLGLAWNCSAEYAGNNTGWPDYDAGIGIFYNNIWDNGYGGYSTTYTPPSSGSDSLAYGQYIDMWQ
jgi:hypothetical protein